MYVNFDVSALATHKLTGVAVYVVELIKAITHGGKINGSVSYKLSRWKKAHLIQSQVKNNLNLPIASFYSNLLPPACDIFHGPDYWIPACGKFKKVVTIHDLSIFNSHYWPKEVVNKSSKTFEKIIHQHRPHAIITVSDFVKYELISRFPQVEGITHTVYHGADHLTSSTPVPPVYDFEYMLYIGTVETRKNVLNLLQAYKNANKELKGLKWIIAGGTHGYGGAYIKSVIDSENNPDIIQLGYVDAFTAKSLIKHAKFLVYPSLYEGFGFPILEAMQLGTPVITSNFGAMSEVASHAALKVNTKHTDEFAQALIDLNNQAALREQLINMGHVHVQKFTWQKCAENTLKVYHALH